MLDAWDPMIVNGYELVQLASTTENVMRSLFLDAEKDQTSGRKSRLHIIVIDYLDVIVKRSETVVNQLLSKVCFTVYFSHDGLSHS